MIKISLTFHLLFIIEEILKKRENKHKIKSTYIALSLYHKITSTYISLSLNHFIFKFEINTKN